MCWKDDIIAVIQVTDIYEIKIYVSIICNFNVRAVDKYLLFNSQDYHSNHLFFYYRFLQINNDMTMR